MKKATVTQRDEAPGDEGATEARCTHHWLIESPQGPTSMGICKLCGSQKEFRNSGSDFLWEDEPLSELSRGRWGKSRDLHAPTESGGEDDGASGAGRGAVGSTRLA
jgi:hypothetical protein